MRCPNCGTVNADDAPACVNCGAPLRAAVLDDTLIDVTSGEPQFVEREAQGPFQARVGRARVYVAQGGTRGCLIPLALAALVLCCACIGAWAVADALF